MLPFLILLEPVEVYLMLNVVLAVQSLFFFFTVTTFSGVHIPTHIILLSQSLRLHLVSVKGSLAKSLSSVISRIAPNVYFHVA